MTIEFRLTEGGKIFALYGAELIRDIVAQGQADIDAAASTATTTITGLTAQAEAARDAALTAETNAESAETLAEEWASNPEDDEITGNSGKFSALHWSEKSKDYRDEALGYAGAASTSATQAATSATAAQTAETGAEAAETGTIAAIAGAGGTLGDVTLEAATIAILEALDTATGSTAFLTQAGRGGLFELVDYAANAALVDADTVKGVFARSTDDITKAWKRVSDYLTPEMFGCPTADDTNALRIMGHLATGLGLPMRAGKGPYRIGDRWYVGSLTAAPAAGGVADGLQMTGLWRFILTATAIDGDVEIDNSSDILLGDFDFDLVTDASPVGSGGVQINDGCSNVRFGTITKMGVEANSYPTGGGNGNALRIGNADLVVGKAVSCHYPQPNASAVATFGANRIHIDYVRGVGLQDAVDLGGSRDCYFGLIEAEDCNEALDCGNSSRNTIGAIIAKNCATVASIKTEITTSGDQDGSNDNTIGAIYAEEYTEFIVRMAGGSTVGVSNQTLHNLKVGKIVGRTTTATASTIAIRTYAGDNGAAGDYTSGLTLPHIDIEQNLGETIELAEMVNYSLGAEYIRSTAPSFLSSDVPAAFWTTRTNGRIANFVGVGDITFSHSGVTVENGRLTGGTFHPINSIGSRFRNLTLIDPPVDGFDIEFGALSVGVADKDVDIENVSCSNPGVGRYALRARGSAASDPIQGVRIDGLEVSGTSGSYATQFTLGSFDKCELRRAINRGLAVPTIGAGFTGLDSFNDPSNRLNTPTLSSGAAAITLEINHANRTMILSDPGPDLTIPADSTTAFPIGTVIRAVGTVGTVTVAAAAGVTIAGVTTSSGVNGFVRMEKTAANAWLVTREG